VFAHQGVVGKEPVLAREVDAGLERAARALLVRLPAVVDVGEGEAKFVARAAAAGVDALLLFHEATP
jgi:hypothetical protein